MTENPAPEPMPTPTNPNPGAIPMEVDTGELHSLPEVEYGNEPMQPLEPQPETPHEPGPEREQPSEPDIEPGRE